MLQLILLSIITTVGAELKVGVTTLDGNRLDGTLQSVTPAELVIETASGTQVFAAGELLSVIPSGVTDPIDSSVAMPAMQVVLVDGSQLSATAFAVENRRATIQLSEGGLVRTSTDKIESVRFKKQDTSIQEQWQDILDGDRSGDVIVVRKTSPATQEAPIAVALDHLEGILDDITSDAIAFEYDGDQVNVSRSKVEGVFYHHPRPAATRELACRLLGLSDSRWNVRSLRIQASTLELVSCAGVRYAMRLDQVAKFDYAPANLVYLSDLQPESETWRPHVFSKSTPPSVSQWFRPRDNRPMLLRGEAYQNGLTLHSRTRLTYRLSQDYKRFWASAGIDDRHSNEGHVFLRISSNRGVLFEGDVQGGSEPLELDLDVRGVRRLTILVDFGPDDTDLGDHLNLCNARFTK